MKICSQKDCVKPSHAKGLCSTHYSRLYRQGNPNIVKIKGKHKFPTKSKITILLDYAEVELSQNKFALISLEDVDIISKFKWNYNNEYAVSYRASGNNSNISMHNFLLKPPIGKMVDHINRDKLDNRRENLRIVDNRINQLNSENFDNSKGYYLQKSTGKFFVQFKFAGESLYLGTYSTETQAKKVALAAKVVIRLSSSKEEFYRLWKDANN